MQNKNPILFQTANHPVDLRRLSSSQTYMGLHAVPLHQEEETVEYSSDELLLRPQWGSHKTEEWNRFLRSSILLFLLSSLGYQGDGWRKATIVEMIESLDDIDKIYLREAFVSLQEMKARFEAFYEREYNS